MTETKGGRIVRRGFQFTFAAALTLAVAASMGTARGGEEKKVAAAGAPNPAWDSMKTLVGEWDGAYDGKVAAKATYRLVSNGTALMETLASPDHSEMVTMYHQDGSRIAMTHYCSENNQPRLRADAQDPKRIAFRYVDATNLASPDAGHMTGLVVTLKDPDHFTQEWTHSGGGHAMTSTFAYTRKK
jgi:hypothetical protein